LNYDGVGEIDRLRLIDLRLLDDQFLGAQQPLEHRGDLAPRRLVGAIKHAHRLHQRHCGNEATRLSGEALDQLGSCGGLHGIVLREVANEDVRIEPHVRVAPAAIAE